MPSLYETLGIEKGASTEEIRRAYKDLAKQKHPDRGGNPEEFKQIQEAHEVLTDEQRRRMYDMTGSVDGNAGGGPVNPGGMGGFPFEFMAGGGPFGMGGPAFDIGSMFGNMFGGGAPRKQPRQARGPNKHHDIFLTLADFYNGREINLKFNQGRRCNGCSGTGAEKTEPCGPCSGRGVRMQVRMIGPGMVAQSTEPCDVCSGEGKRVIRQCMTCHGKKFKEREKELNIVIRPGMSENETMNFPGECSDSANYDTPGDVILILKRSDPPQSDLDGWEWRGHDLHIRKKITFSESVIGFKKELLGHPSGKRIVVGWRKGVVINGSTLQAAGWGMPKKEGGFGNCFIEFVVEAPASKEWTSEERETLRNLLGGDVETIETEEIIPLTTV